MVPDFYSHSFSLSKIKLFSPEDRLYLQMLTSKCVAQVNLHFRRQHGALVSNFSHLLIGPMISAVSEQHPHYELLVIFLL